MNPQGLELHSIEMVFSDRGIGQSSQVDGILRRDGWVIAVGWPR
jgi:hypothetical protein